MRRFGLHCAPALGLFFGCVRYADDGWHRFRFLTDALLLGKNDNSHHRPGPGGMVTCALEPWRQFLSNTSRAIQQSLSIYACGRWAKGGQSSLQRRSGRRSHALPNL